jgi:lactate 2-monooxygenase
MHERSAALAPTWRQYGILHVTRRDARHFPARLQWCAHDLVMVCIPFAAVVGIQVGTSGTVYGTERSTAACRKNEPPLDLDAFHTRLAVGDRHVLEANSVIFRSWEDLAFWRAKWDGPTVLKRIQTVKDAHAAMDGHIDGIIVANHGRAPGPKRTSPREGTPTRN